MIRSFHLFCQPSPTQSIRSFTVFVLHSRDASVRVKDVLNRNSPRWSTKVPQSVPRFPQSHVLAFLVGYIDLKHEN